MDSVVDAGAFLSHERLGAMSIIGDDIFESVKAETLVVNLTVGRA